MNWDDRRGALQAPDLQQTLEEGRLPLFLSKVSWGSASPTHPRLQGGGGRGRHPAPSPGREGGGGQRGL